MSTEMSGTGKMDYLILGVILDGFFFVMSSLSFVVVLDVVIVNLVLLAPKTDKTELFNSAFRPPFVTLSHLSWEVNLRNSAERYRTGLSISNDSGIIEKVLDSLSSGFRFRFRYDVVSEICFDKSIRMEISMWNKKYVNRVT